MAPLVIKPGQVLAKLTLYFAKKLPKIELSILSIHLVYPSCISILYIHLVYPSCGMGILARSNHEIISSLFRYILLKESKNILKILESIFFRLTLIKINLHPVIICRDAPKSRLYVISEI